MPRSGKKCKSNSNGTTIASPALTARFVCQPPPNIRQGHRCKLADSIELRTVKVAITLAVQKTEAKILVVYCTVLPAVFTSQKKQTKEGKYDINLANQLTIKMVIPMYYEISRLLFKVPDSCFCMDVRGKCPLTARRVYK